MLGALQEALRERVGERSGSPLMRITMQCACWLCWRGHSESELIRLRNGLRQGSSEALMLWGIRMRHTMAPLAATWTEELQRMWIPSIPTTTPRELMQFSRWIQHLRS